MSGVLDRLIELCIQWFKWFLPFVIIDHWEEAIVLRFGKYHRSIRAGFNWKWPCGIEQIVRDHVNAQTIDLPVQSLVTKDGVKVQISAVVTTRICDISRSLLEAESIDEALKDSCVGEVGLLVAESNWADMRKRAFHNELTRRCRESALRYGQRIEKVQLKDCTPANSLRLWMEK
jgi:regulator of protease activity HflC (stomatin/prohibitin superfamily)